MSGCIHQCRRVPLASILQSCWLPGESTIRESNCQACHQLRSLFSFHGLISTQCRIWSVWKLWETSKMPILHECRRSLFLVVLTCHIDKHWFYKRGYEAVYQLTNDDFGPVVVFLRKDLTGKQPLIVFHQKENSQAFHGKQHLSLSAKNKSICQKV